MKILLYSRTFWPNVGGVEDVAHALAEGLVDFGHQVTVVTTTFTAQERQTKYSIVRRPALATLIKLVAMHDVIHANGSSPRLFPLAFFMGKPFTWTHHGYQLQCIDGAGWVDGQPAPLSPMASIKFHRAHFGLIQTFGAAIKLYFRRVTAFIVTANIASSQHLAKRQPLPRQRVVYNPFSQDLFNGGKIVPNHKKITEADSLNTTTFIFIGRLISEKGVDDLLYAMHELASKEIQVLGKKHSTLKIIGEGPDKEKLQILAQDLDLAGVIKWEGFLSAQNLKLELDKAAIGIIPSAWEEPGALIILELLAAGKPVIVSDKGWLVECAGEACMSFPNRNRQALAQAMQKLSQDQNLQIQLSQAALKRIKQFDARGSIQAYIRLFAEVSH